MCGAPWWIHDVLSTSTAAIQIQRKHNSCHANEGVGGKAYTTKNKGMRNRQIGERRGEHTHTHTHTHTHKRAAPGCMKLWTESRLMPPLPSTITCGALSLRRCATWPMASGSKLSSITTSAPAAAEHAVKVQSRGGAIEWDRSETISNNSLTRECV